MTGFKPSIWKILSAAAALALMLPQLAFGEFGVCPPYSKTFGPEDPPAEILAFIDEINTRPGGGTVILDGGRYEGLIDDISITGVVCLRWSGVPAPDHLYPHPVLGTRPDAGPGDVVMRVEAGAILTAHSVRFRTPTLGVPDLLVDPGATLFAYRAGFVRLVNHGDAFLDDSSAGGAGIENHGTLRMSGGGISGVEIFSGNDGIGFINGASAYAFLERVMISNNEYSDDRYAEGGGIRNDGVLTLANSIVTDNGASIYDCSGEGIYNCSCSAFGLDNRGTADVVGSTIAHNKPDFHMGKNGCGFGIRNTGYIEVSQSVVADNVIPDHYEEWECTSYTCPTECIGPVTDLGYNVFDDESCLISEATSILADPEFLAASEYPPDSVELSASSPAIDRIPLELCSETDMLGRERTDGDHNGLVACDSGALEYGYASMPVTVRTIPYWRETGTLDLSRQVALFVSVFSTADFDATDILFDTIDLEGLDEYALRGPALIDANRDGYLDIAVWYRLDRMAPFACGSYDQRFEAMTDDGRLVTGQLRFEVVGCAP